MGPEIINGLFALGGASIGVIGAFIIAKSSKKISKLIVHKSPVAKLLDVGDFIKSDVEIHYKGKSITGLYGGEFAVQNTGTQSVENIKLQINPLDDSPIIDFAISTANFPVDRSEKPSNNDLATIDISIPFLNPKDRICYSYTVAGEGHRPEIIARKINVNITVKDEITSYLPDIYAEVLYESMAKETFPRIIFSLLHKDFKMYLESKRENNT